MKAGYKIKIGDLIVQVVYKWHGNRKHKKNNDCDLLRTESGVYEVKKI